VTSPSTTHLPGDLEQLRSMALFAAIDECALEMVCGLARRRLDPGQTVFEEGDPSHTMYVILDGEVEIVKHTAAGPLRVARLGAGEWFGEVGLIGVSRRVATARALQAARLVEIHARELRELYQRDVKSYALLTMNLARGMARKLQHAEAMLAEAHGRSS
jgi:CRP/FNR family transcriptional regulator, cyclic AMP receptor protein